jgi:hypothetical protein
MNSPFIDDNTLEQVGFIENGHSRLVYRPRLEKKIREGLKEVMEGTMLTPQQVAQLKNLSSYLVKTCIGRDFLISIEDVVREPRTRIISN